MDHLNFCLIASIIYLIAVILFPIRKGKQPFMPWFLAIVFQLASMVFLKDIEIYLLYVWKYFFEENAFVQKNIEFLSLGICLLCNSLLIFIFNGIRISIEKKKENKRKEKLRASRTKTQLENDIRTEQLQKDIAAAVLEINARNKERGRL